MSNINSDSVVLEFNELETRFGRANALAILRSLEQFEGVLESRVSTLSHEARMRNVFRMMQDNMRFQTRH